MNSALLADVPVKADASAAPTFSVYPADGASMTYSDGAITVTENGLCSVNYNLVYVNNTSEKVTSVLTLYGEPVEVTRRTLQGQSGAGSSYLFAVKAGDKIQVEVDGAQSLESASLNIGARFYKINET